MALLNTVVATLGLIGIAFGVYLAGLALCRTDRVFIREHKEDSQPYSARSTNLQTAFDVFALLMGAALLQAGFLWAVDMVPGEVVAVVAILCLIFLSAGVVVPSAGLVVEDSFIADMTAPRRIYVGDSAPITVRVVRTSFEVSHRTLGEVVDTPHGSLVPFSTEAGTGILTIDASLIAAGATVSGATSQSLRIDEVPLVFRWLVFFNNSGVHFLTLTLATSAEGIHREIASVTHKLTVVRLDHLTSRHIWLCGLVLGGIPTVWTLVVALVRLLTY